jgi:hypothetical protein
VAARKTDMVRFGVFAVHQLIIGDFPTGPPDVQKRTQICSRGAKDRGEYRQAAGAVAQIKKPAASKSWGGAVPRCEEI